MNSSWLDFPSLYKVAGNKKIIFWGCYDWFEKTYVCHNWNVEFIVDMSKNQQGKKAHHGFDVLDPSELKKEKYKKDYYIIISTTAFYEVIDQLVKWGFQAGQHFSVTPLLQNFRVIDEMLKHKNELLISSSDTVQNSRNSGGGVYKLDVVTGEKTKKINGVTRGFDSDGKHLFVVDALVGVRVFNKQFKELDCFKLPDQCVPHGIIVDPARKIIFVAHTRHDSIGIYDLKTFKNLDTLKVSDKYDKSGVYHHHINDMHLVDDSLYVSMFSLTGNVQKSVFDGGVMEYRIDTHEWNGAVVKDLWQPHSVKFFEGSLCFLDSMRGNLHIATHKIESHFNGFVRGLDFDGKYYYVGQSIHRYFDRMKGTSNNISIDCGVFLFDVQSKASKFVPVSNLKDINTLRIVKHDNV